MQTDHLSAVRFIDLPLHPSLQAGLTQLGYSHCTPIQAQALPKALNGEDLAGQAQTGTGKSAAFLLATMNHRSEEHTSELQSLMRISYAVFCLKKKKKTTYKQC